MTNININICQSLLERMNDGVRKVVILTHANPDGDALGSSLGLNNVLQNAGFSSTVIFPTDFPPILPSLNDYKGWFISEHREKESEKLIKEADVIFMLDFNDIRRVGKVKKWLEQPSAKLVLIDHHPQPAIEADWLFSDTSVSSTAELVYDFVCKMGWGGHLDPLGAQALLTGIIADTASFSHNARKKELYSAVSDLIGKGADQYKIQQALFNTNTEDRLKLLGFALSEKMEILPGFHAAIISLKREELKKYNFKIGDTEGFVNYPLSIKGIIFSVFLLENEEKIKLSFRSRGGFAVNDFSAKHFSGGGHRNASGGESRQSLEEVIQQLKELLPQYAEILETESLKEI